MKVVKLCPQIVDASLAAWRPGGAAAALAAAAAAAAPMSLADTADIGVHGATEAYIK